MDTPQHPEDGRPEKPSGAGDGALGSTPEGTPESTPESAPESTETAAEARIARALTERFRAEVPEPPSAAFDDAILAAARQAAEESRANRPRLRAVRRLAPWAAAAAAACLLFLLSDHLLPGLRGPVDSADSARATSARDDAAPSAIAADPAAAEPRDPLDIADAWHLRRRLAAAGGSILLDPAGPGGAATPEGDAPEARLDRDGDGRLDRTDLDGLLASIVDLDRRRGS